MIETSEQQKTFNEKEAANYLGLAVQTLRNWRFQSRGPTYLKLSPGPRGRVVYLVEDLDAYRKECRVEHHGS